MPKYTKEEQETIITFNRAEKSATLFTTDAKMAGKMKELGFKGVKTEGGGVTFTLPNKKSIQIRVYRGGRKLTDDERQEIAERLAAGKAAKAKLTKKSKKAKKPAPVEEEEGEEEEEEEAPAPKKAKKAAKPAKSTKPAKKSKKAKVEEEEDELDDVDDEDEDEAEDEKEDED